MAPLRGLLASLGAGFSLAAAGSLALLAITAVFVLQGGLDSLRRRVLPFVDQLDADYEAARTLFSEPRPREELEAQLEQVRGERDANMRRLAAIRAEMLARLVRASASAAVLRGVIASLHEDVTLAGREPDRSLRLPRVVPAGEPLRPLGYSSIGYEALTAEDRRVRAEVNAEGQQARRAFARVAQSVAHPPRGALR